MGAQKDGRIPLAETLRSRAAVSCFPFRRDQLTTLARLSEQEAKLKRLSYDCILQSKDLIGRAEILLRRR
jgi:hypothetical protein